MGFLMTLKYSGNFRRSTGSRKGHASSCFSISLSNAAQMAMSSLAALLRVDLDPLRDCRRQSGHCHGLLGALGRGQKRKKVSRGKRLVVQSWYKSATSPGGWWVKTPFVVNLGALRALQQRSSRTVTHGTASLPIGLEEEVEKRIT